MKNCLMGHSDRGAGGKVMELFLKVMEVFPKVMEVFLKVMEVFPTCLKVRSRL